jgi:hypothetical protein
VLLGLLLVSSVVLLCNPPGVSSQALTTVTSTPEPIHYTSWPYDYDSLTDTFSLGETQTKLLPCCFGDWDTFPCFYYDYFVFNATAGQEINGQFTTEGGRSVGFYVLDSAQFARFGYSGCQVGSWPWDLYAFAPTWDFNWTVPESGLYVFLFLSAPFYGGDIHFTAQTYSTIDSPSPST